MTNPFHLIVAMDRARGIGREGRMPWHLPGDMRLFSDLTKGPHRLDPSLARNTVIMGRRTWDSLPSQYRPLPDRLNLVLSRRAEAEFSGATRATSLDQALSQASGEAFVIGGGEIYRLAIAHPACHSLFITEIDGEYDCDAFFPALPDSFEIEERGAWQQDQLEGPAYRLTRWTRAMAAREAEA